MVEEYTQIGPDKARLDLFLEHYNPLPSQRRFHNSPAKFRAYVGGVGSGKSLALCYEAIRCGYVNAGTMGLLASPTFRMSRDILEPQILRILDEENIPHHFNKSDRAIDLTMPRTSILLRSVDDPEKLRGTNLSFLGFDEAAMCSEAPWMRLEARLRDPRAAWLTGFIATTPQGKNWLYDRFVNPSKKLPNHEAILARPRENIHLQVDFYENLKHSYSERFFAQEVEAKFISQFVGGAYWAFTHEENVKQTFYDPALPVCFSLDFNVDPMSAVIAQKHPVSLNGMEHRFHILDEIVLPGSNTTEMCAAFAERTRKWIPAFGKLKVRVFGDPSGNSRQTSATETDYEIMRNYFARQQYYDMTFWIDDSHPQVRDRCQLVNSMLKNAAGEARIWISPKCESLILDLELVHFKEDIFGNILPVLDKQDSKRTHISDALGYMIWTEQSAFTPARFVRDYVF